MRRPLHKDEPLQDATELVEEHQEAIRRKEAREVVRKARKAATEAQMPAIRGQQARLKAECAARQRRRGG